MKGGERSERVLVLLPSGDDGARMVSFLAEANVHALACRDVDHLCAELRAGAASVLTSDDALEAANERVAAVLRDAPAWSSMPFVVVAREGRTAAFQERAPEAMTALVVVERPVRASSLLSVVSSSLRARRHQYQMRDAMLARDAQADALARQAEVLSKQEAQLRSADRRKDDFLATLAHELRNPLAPLRTGLDVLDGSTTDPSARRALGVMQRQLAHMVRLIDDLLDVSRITRGKLELKRERVTLGRVVDAAVEALRPQIAAAGHELRLDVQGATAALDADPTRLAQVVGNLLSNASKYTPTGGKLELSTRVVADDARDGGAGGGGAAVEIVVRDTGVGLEPARLDDVFEMFNQVESAIDRAQGGLGIGLALVRSFVEMHGGTVCATSEGLGKGTTFVVRLPIAEGAEEPAHASGPRAPVESDGRRRVLVVDDNVDAAELLSFMLEQGGYVTTTAGDGPAAIAAVRADAPDVVILDIGLPGMSGYEVARALRGDPAARKLLLVALTGWGSAEDKRKAEDAGFDLHLTKPVDGKALFGALERLTAGAAQS